MGIPSTEQSPLPWSYRPFNDRRKWFEILDANDDPVNVDFKSEADVALIVRAVNNHAPLLDALEEIERHHVEQNRRKGRDESRSHTLKIARAAIAQAKG